MSSIGESIMVAVYARLTGSPSLSATVKRSHRTLVTRDSAPMVHLIDGADTPREQKNCRTARTKAFTVGVFVRSDSGASAADALVVAINERLDGWSGPGDLKQGRIAPDEEIADLDAVFIGMEFTCDYNTSGWALDA